MQNNSFRLLLHTWVRSCGSLLHWGGEKAKRNTERTSEWDMPSQSPSAFKLVGLELDKNLQKGVGYYSQALRNWTADCHSNFLMLIHAT